MTRQEAEAVAAVSGCSQCVCDLAHRLMIAGLGFSFTVDGTVEVPAEWAEDGEVYTDTLPRVIVAES